MSDNRSLPNWALLLGNALREQIPDGERHLFDDPEILSEWMDGSPSEQSRKKILDHLRSCGQCREFVGRLIGSGDVHLVDLLAAEDRQELNADEPSDQPRISDIAPTSRKKLGTQSWWIYAVAAVILLGVGMAPFIPGWVGPIGNTAREQALVDFDFDLRGESTARGSEPLAPTPAEIAQEQRLRQQTTRPGANLSAWRQLGQIYLNQRRYGEALESFNHVLAQQPGDFDAHLGAGISDFARARERDDLLRALVHFQQSATIRPKSSAAALNIAICLQRLFSQTTDATDRKKMAAEAIESWKQARMMTFDESQQAEIDELIAELKTIAEE